MLRRLATRKTLVRLLFAGALVLTLLLVAFACENWRGARAWQRYQRAAEARGEKLWIAQFIPPPVPDAENFAAIPLFEAIAKDPGARQPLFDLGFPEGVSQPALANPALAERFDPVKWRDTFVKAKQLDAPTDSAPRDLLRALERFEPALQQLRDASRRPHSRFVVNWDAGFQAILPHLGPLQGAARIFVLRMEAHLALGESAPAYAAFRDGLAIYRALRDEPVLISGLVRVSILRLLENAVWDGMAADVWAEPELRALAADFAALRLVEDWRFAIASERAGANTSLERLISHPEQLGFLLSDGYIRVPTAADHVRGRLFPRGWLRQNQVKINEFFDTTLAGIDPAAPSLPGGEEQDARIDRQIGRGGVRIYYALANMLMPVLGTAGDRYLTAHTSAQQARTACALALHRRAHGAYPESLDALVPEFLESVPRDICDGAPLRYRRTEAGYDLWSIGPNRVDDGAKSLPNKIERRQPDWVWRLL